VASASLAQEDEKRPTTIDEKEWSVPEGSHWTQIRRPQLSLSHTQLFQPGSKEAREAFDRLEKEVQWLSEEQSKIKVSAVTSHALHVLASVILQVFGRVVAVPRKQAGYGDEGVTYSYSGLTLSALPWCPVLRELRQRVCDSAGVPFNFVLVNRYANGDDYAGEHRDDERELDPKAPIASLTLGAERDFYFKHANARSCATKRRKETSEAESPPAKLTLSLRDGQLLLMNPPTNRHWYHGLPKRKTCKRVRINLTFRRVLDTAKAASKEG